MASPKEQVVTERLHHVRAHQSSYWKAAVGLQHSVETHPGGALWLSGTVPGAYVITSCYNKGLESSTWKVASFL